MFKKLKNKKGYTLVEIIAAIVILAILILIAVPAINKQLINFRLNYYKKLENSVVSASKDYVTDRRYSKPTKLFHSKVIKVSDLEKEGYIDEVKDYLGKKCDSTDTSYSYVVVVKTGEKQYDYTTCLKCSQDEYATDTTGQKNNYCDTAWMNDNNIEYELREDVGKKLYVYYGTNEESIRDELRLTYDVVKKNNDGEVLAKKESDDENDALYPQNIGELVGQNVNTVINLRYILPSGETLQKQAVIYKHNQPEIEMKYGVDNIYSGKKKNDVYSNGSDEWASNLVVKISYSKNDVKEVIDAIALKDIEYYDEVRKKWIETNCTVSSDKKSCTWTVKNDFDKEIKFRVVNDRSKKGDSGDYYSIKVDAHKPECTLNKSGTIGLDNWYTSDVTFNFDTKTDVLSGVGKFDITDSKTQTFNNRATSVLSTDSTNKTYYGHVVDKAGNTNICDITVKRDATAPSCSINPTGTIGDNNWYTSDVAIALSTDDATSKVLSYDLSRSTTATYNKAASSSLKDDTTGVDYYGYVKDNAGNTGKCSINIKRDATAPTCTVTPTGTKGDNGWYTSNVSISLAATDATSKVSVYDLTNSSTASYNKVSSKSLTTDTTGIDYYGYIKDNAGNINNCGTKVKRDTVKPTVPTIENPTKGEWTNKSFSLTVNSKDNTAGIDYWYYSYDQSEWTKYDKGDYDSYEKETYITSPFSKERESLAYIRVCDKAGHCSTSSTWIRIDKTEPTCDVVPTGTIGTNDWFTSNVTLTLDIQDNGSEVNGYGLSEESATTYNGTKTLYLKSDITSKTYYGFVKDTAGNNATCQVTVKRDTTIPSCKITPTGTQGTNSWYIGDVSIKLTTSDSTSKVNSYDLTTSSNVTYSKNTTMSLTKDTTGQKYYAYVKDNAGLTNKCEITIKRDTKKPSCTVTPSGTKGNNDWYTTNVGITLTTSDATSDVISYDLTNSSTASYNKTKTTDTLATDVKTKTYYGYVKDYAGHVNSCSVTVKRDTTKPTCTITPTGTMGSNSWYTSNVALNMTTNDDTSTVKGYDLKTTNSASYGGNSALSLTSDVATITYYGFVKDDAGHTNTCTKTIKRDATKPTCSITPSGTKGNDNWYKSNVALTLTPKDNLSDVHSYDLTTSSSATYAKTSSKTQTVDTTGQKYYGYVKDNAGNTGTCDITVKKDVVKPTCTLTPTGTLGTNSWYISDVKVTISRDDDTSKVHSYDLTRNEVATYNETTEVILKDDTDGITYYGYVKDNAGWTNTCKVTVKRDVSEPTCTITPSGTKGLSDWYTSNVKFTIVPDDATSYNLSTSTTPSYSGTKELTLSSDTKSKTYYGYVKDDAGLTGKCQITVKRDATKPTCSLSPSGTAGSNGWFTSNVTVSFGSKSDATSDVLTYDLTTNKTATFNKATSKVQEDETNGQIYYGHVKDKAGNIGSCQLTVKKDTVKPMCTITPTGTVGSNNWFVSDVTITMNPMDLGGSAVNSYGLTTSSTVNYNGKKTTQLTTDTNSQTYHCFAKDDAGNTYTRSETFKRDASKPAVPTIEHPYNGNWTNQSFKLKVSSSDAYSGLADWYYSWNQSSWTKYANSYNVSPFTTLEFSEDKNQLVYIRICDQAGNCNISSSMIRIDKQAPSCTLTPSGTVGNNSWYTSNVKLTLGVTNSGSEIVKTGITKSTSATYDTSVSYEKTISDDMGETTYYGYIKDSAGNTAKCQTKIKKDSTAPSCSFSATGTLGDNSWYKSNVVLTLNRSDATSDIASFGINSSNSATYNSSTSQTINWETSGATYYGFVKDNAGNTNSCSKTVKRDTTPPSCKIEATGDNSGGIFYSTVNIKMTPSGHSYYGMSTTNSTTYNSVSTDTITSDVSGRTYYGFVKDAAGWTNTCNVTVTRIGKVSVSFNGNGNTGGSTAAQQCLYNASCTLNSNGFTKTGYTFTGWNTKADGSGTSYSSSGKFTAGTTLYAQWRINKLYIYYNANGASISSSSYSLSSNNVYSGGSRFYQTINYGSSSDPYNASTFGLYKTGYSFVGWNTNSSGTGTTYGQDTSYAATTYKSDLTGGDKSITLYAIYNVNTYTLTYNNNNGSGCSSKTANYGSTWGTLCTPTRANYTFNGWYDGSTQVTASTTVGGNRTVTASWTAIAPTCGTISGHTGGWTKSKYVSVGCTNPNGTACTAVGNTYTSSGYKELTITGSNGATRKCGFTVENIDTGTPTVTFNGHVASNVKCPSGSAYSWLDNKWTFTISNTSSGFRESGSTLVVSISGVGTGTHNYGAPKASSGITLGCAFFSTTEFGFARSGKPSMTATACNNVGNCGSNSG